MSIPQMVILGVIGIVMNVVADLTKDRKKQHKERIEAITGLAIAIRNKNKPVGQPVQQI